MRPFVTLLFLTTAATFAFAVSIPTNLQGRQLLGALTGGAAPATDPAAIVPSTGTTLHRKKKSKHHSHSFKSPSKKSHHKASTSASVAKRAALDERGLEVVPTMAMERKRQLGALGALGGLTSLGGLTGGNGAAGGGLGGLGSITGLIDIQGLTGLTGLLGTSTTGMARHQAKIRQYARKAKHNKNSHMSSAFQNSIYKELKAYRGSAAGLPGLSQLDRLLKPLGPDQGLANFNRNDPVQVLLRTMTSSIQDTLESVDLIVYQIPVLGPILGPILYDIKCIVDDILNVGEVVLDGLLNDLQPELKGLSGNYLTSVCRMAQSLSVC